MTARAFWLLCLILGSSPAAPVAEGKGKSDEMLSLGRGAGVRELGTGSDEGPEEKRGPSLQERRRRVRVRREQTVSPRLHVSWQPFRKEARSATEMISSEPGRLEKTLHVK